MELRCNVPVYLTSTCEPSGKETCIGRVTCIGFTSREKLEHIWLEALVSTIHVPISVGY